MQDPITHDSIRLELDRILNSREFSRAEYLCRFLRCCVEETLNGNIAQLKEFWLGRSVFQRDSGFNPSADPIVRVQARRLRQKLERYYNHEGRESTFRIAIPTGSYVPRFLTGRQALQPPPPTRRKLLSLAVLPFITLDQAVSGFASILADELVHSIVESGRFLVVSRLSSARFKDTLEDARAIGKSLSADVLMEGRVREGERGPAVSIQLTDATTGYHLLSASFECTGASTSNAVDEIVGPWTALLEASRLGGPLVGSISHRFLQS